MQEYLKYALEFEKYVYIWTGALNQADVQLQKVRNDHIRLARVLADEKSRALSAETSINSIESRHNNLLLQKQNKARSYHKSIRIIKILYLIISVFMFLFGCVCGFVVFNQGKSDSLALTVLFFGLLLAIIGPIITGILPICMIANIFLKSKAKNCEKEAEQIARSNSRERERMFLEEQKNNWQRMAADTIQSQSDNYAKETIIEKRRENIIIALQNAKNTLAQIYSKNVLPAKYHSLGCVATLYEYLATGRCNAIYGHGGIFDTYETEKIQIEQLEQMIRMNQALNRIEDGQRMIYSEMQQANKTLSGINSNLVDIKSTANDIARTADKIERNTAISAAANRQTADAASWIAWQGYGYY